MGAEVSASDESGAAAERHEGGPSCWRDDHSAEGVGVTAVEDLKAGWTLPGNCLPYELSRHAIERFGERERPGLAAEMVRSQMLFMLPNLCITKTPPEWFAPAATGKCDFYVHFTPDVVGTVVEHPNVLVVTSVFDRWTLSDSQATKRRYRTEKTRLMRAGGQRRTPKGRAVAGPRKRQWDDET